VRAAQRPHYCCVPPTTPLLPPVYTTQIGNSPLHEAAKAGYDDVVQCLLENGARPGITNHEHDTALDVAVKNGHTHMHELLVECNDAAGMHRAPSN
jgi:ankyrin repeat protein